MATGIINNPCGEEDITITLDSSKVSLASWGNVTGKRVGNIVFVRFHGVIFRQTTTSAYDIATMSVTSKANTVQPVHTGSAQNGFAITENNSNKIRANGISNTSSACYCEMIFPV